MIHAAFIGLGNMGYPMAGHLANAGHTVTVYNRTPERAAQWVGEYQGQQAETPALAARGADVNRTNCIGEAPLRGVDCTCFLCLGIVAHMTPQHGTLIGDFCGDNSTCNRQSGPGIKSGCMLRPAQQYVAGLRAFDTRQQLAAIAKERDRNASLGGKSHKCG